MIPKRATKIDNYSRPNWYKDDSTKPVPDSICKNCKYAMNAGSVDKSVSFFCNYIGIEGKLKKMPSVEILPDGHRKCKNFVKGERMKSRAMRVIL